MPIPIVKCGDRVIELGPSLVSVKCEACGKEYAEPILTIEWFEGGSRTSVTGTCCDDRKLVASLEPVAARSKGDDQDREQGEAVEIRL
jgi:hypothetical protein